MEKTGNFKTPEFHRHTFRVVNRTKTYTVYELIDIDKGINYLTDILRIEDFRGKSNTTGISDYLRLRTASSWANSEQVTGLRSTGVKKLYHGNRVKDQSKSLIMFYFTEGKDQLTEEPEVQLVIDYYPHYYPLTSKIFEQIINTYKTK